MKQRRLTSRTTATEVAKRVEACELLLSRGYRKSQIHEAMHKQFKVTWKMTDIYIGRAREKMIVRLSRARDEHRSDSLAFYESMLQSNDVKAHDKILARKRIDELLGLDAPKRHELSGPNGKPVQTEDKTERPTLSPAELKAAVLKLRTEIASAETVRTNGH